MKSKLIIFCNFALVVLAVILGLNSSADGKKEELFFKFKDKYAEKQVYRTVPEVLVFNPSNKKLLFQEDGFTDVSEELIKKLEQVIINGEVLYRSLSKEERLKEGNRKMEAYLEYFEKQARAQLENQFKGEPDIQNQILGQAMNDKKQWAKKAFFLADPTYDEILSEIEPEGENPNAGLQISGDKPVLFKFYSEKCSPCKKQTEIIEKFVANHGLKFTMINVRRY